MAKADPVWIPPQGTVHAALSFTQALWDQYLQDFGESVALPGKVSQYEITAHIDWTIWNNLSLDLIFPIVISQKNFSFLQTDFSGEILGVALGPDGQVRDVATNVGLGDMTLGGKYIFWDEGVSLGLRSFVKIPGSYDVGDLPNAPGDGQTDFGILGLVGSYFPEIRTYLRGSFGFVGRTGYPANQLELTVEPGVKITESFAARFFYRYINQLGGTDFVYYADANFYPENEEDSHRIGFGLSYMTDAKIGFFGLYQQTVAGRNTANTLAFTAGIDFLF